MEKVEPKPLMVSREEVARVKKELKKKSKSELINIIINLSDAIDRLKESKDVQGSE